MTAPAQPAPSPLVEILAERISANGPITFAEYMETALYHPQHGYYTKAGAPPRRDYFTSVDVSPVVWAVAGKAAARNVDEAGFAEEFHAGGSGCGRRRGAGEKHFGFVAGQFPAFYEALKYVAVERSASRRAAETALLAKHVARGKFEGCGRFAGDDREPACFFE